jgi:hypothetical protein
MLAQPPTGRHSKIQSCVICAFASDSPWSCGSTPACSGWLGRSDVIDGCLAPVPEFVSAPPCDGAVPLQDHQPYLSHFTEMYKDPVQGDEPVKYISETQKVGTRTDRMMQQFMAQAAVEPVVAETKTDFTTTKQASYTQQDMSQVKCVRPPLPARLVSTVQGGSDQQSTGAHLRRRKTLEGRR